MSEQVGKHKGAVETLLHEKKELSRLLNIVNSQLQRHLQALEDQGVDTDRFVQNLQEGAQENRQQQQGRKQSSGRKQQSSKDSSRGRNQRSGSNSRSRRQSSSDQDDRDAEDFFEDDDDTDRDFNPMS